MPPCAFKLYRADHKPLADLCVIKTFASNRSAIRCRTKLFRRTEIERRLEPLYSRLRLPAGGLELMTGIRERRLWPAGTLPSQISVISGQARD